MLTFLILGIIIIWCHSFTKLTGVGRKCTTGSLSKLFTLLCTFLSTLLLIIYPSQATSDDPTNDFINNLFNSSRGGSTNVDPWYSSKGRLTGVDPWYYKALISACVHFRLVWTWSCLWMLCCVYMDEIKIVMFEWICWILWCLNECVGFGCIYGCTVYCVCKLYMFYNSSCVIPFSTVFKAQTNVRWLRMCRYRLAFVIYIGRLVDYHG
jgi:hypothetical protein